MITALRYHDFCAGHRVVGHEGKCQNLHGHNYRVTFEIAPDQELDELGRVLDFSVIKAQLCEWIEDNWDHKMLLWVDDPFLHQTPGAGIVAVDFNPTAENMANHLLRVVGPLKLGCLGCRLTSVRLSETRKCSVLATL